LSTVASSTTPQKLLDTIILQVAPNPPARAVLQAHVAFLVGHFSKTYPELSPAVQERMLFPYVLASKSKFRTARGVWEALREVGDTANGWLKGCVDIWENTGLLRGKKVAKDDENEDVDADVEKICQVNLDVAAKIAGEYSFASAYICLLLFFAENILASNDSSSDITLILSKLHDPLPHARALAYLVVRALLLSTSCEQQVEIALRALNAMKLHSVDSFGDISEGSTSLQEACTIFLSYSITNHVADAQRPYAGHESRDKARRKSYDAISSGFHIGVGTGYSTRGRMCSCLDRS
jgi:U3 small nucleolar RNA-associated protein 10